MLVATTQPKFVFPSCKAHSHLPILRPPPVSNACGCKRAPALLLLTLCPAGRQHEPVHASPLMLRSGRRVQRSERADPSQGVPLNPQGVPGDTDDSHPMVQHAAPQGQRLGHRAPQAHNDQPSGFPLSRLSSTAAELRRAGLDQRRLGDGLRAPLQRADAPGEPVPCACACERCMHAALVAAAGRLPMTGRCL